MHFCFIFLQWREKLFLECLWLCVVTKKTQRGKDGVIEWSVILSWPLKKIIRHNPFNQNFWKFRSKTQRIGSVRPEKFWKKMVHLLRWTTFPGWTGQAIIINLIYLRQNHVTYMRHTCVLLLMHLNHKRLWKREDCYQFQSQMEFHDLPTNKHSTLQQK